MVKAGFHIQEEKTVWQAIFEKSRKEWAAQHGPEVPMPKSFDRT
jgi:hypothetical protein